MLVNKIFKFIIVLMLILGISGCSKSVGMPVAIIENVVLVDDYLTFDFLFEENQDHVINSLEAVIMDRNGDEVFSLDMDDGLGYGLNEGFHIYGLNPNEIYNIQIIADYEIDDEISLDIVLDYYEFSTSSWEARVSGVVSNLNIRMNEIAFDVDIDKLDDVVISNLSIIMTHQNGDEYIELYDYSSVEIGENIGLVFLEADIGKDYSIMLSVTYEINGNEYLFYEEIEFFSTPLWDISPVVFFDTSNLSFDEIMFDLSISENQYISVSSINIDLSDSLGNSLRVIDEENGLVVGVNKDLVFNELVFNTEYNIDIKIEYIELSTGDTITYQFDTHNFSTANPTVTDFNEYMIQSILGSMYTIEEVTHLYSFNDLIENIYLIKDDNETISYAYNISFEGSGYTIDSYIRSLVIINLDNTFRYVSIYDDEENEGITDPYYLYDFGQAFNNMSINQESYDVDSVAGSTMTYDKIMVSLEKVANYHLTEVSLIDLTEVIINGKISLTMEELQSIFPEGDTFNEIYVDRQQSDVIKNIYSVMDETNTHVGYVFALRIKGKEDIIEYTLGITNNSVSNDFTILFSNETWEYAEAYGLYDGSFGYFYNTTWIENFEGFDLVNDNIEDIDVIAGVSITTGSVKSSFEDIINYYISNLLDE